MKHERLSGIEILILAVTAVVTVATSKGGGTSAPAPTSRYGVATNCANATQNNIEISVTEGQVTSPTGVTFASFGLPLATLAVSGNQTISGEVAAGVTRSCTLSDSSNNGARMSVYTCADNGTFACQVSLTHL